MRDKLKNQLQARLDEYLESLSTEEKQDIEKNKNDIIQKLMEGNFKDLGGLIAMRGFVYQYYVAMYYILSMIYEKHSSYWNAVILEYFDDITLIGPQKIRFIQVKTIKEGNSHQANDFYKRKQLKKAQDDKSYFNSWVEKNIFNYDIFLDSQISNSIDRSQYSPEFEIISNTPLTTLKSLSRYTENTNFNITTPIPTDDKIKLNILKSVNQKNLASYLKNDIDFYLRKLYINKLGSFNELSYNILQMISEIISETDVRAPSIREYVQKQLFIYIISNSHNDKESQSQKDDLIIYSHHIKSLINQWTQEAKELISEAAYCDTSFGFFSNIITNLEAEFNREIQNNTLKTELLEELNLINQQITNEFSKDNRYFIYLLNKIFNAENTMSIIDFKDSDIMYYLQESFKFIIHFRVFYQNNHEVYNQAKLLFQKGESATICNVLFTIYHARQLYEKNISMEKIKACIHNCEISRKIALDLHCILLGNKDYSNEQSTLGALEQFKISNPNNTPPKITNIPNNIHFVDGKKLMEFFNAFKSADLSLNTFKDKKLLEIWNNQLKDNINKLKERYYEI